MTVEGEKIILTFLARDGFAWDTQSSDDNTESGQKSIADELTILLNFILNSAEGKGHQVSMRKEAKKEDQDGKVIEPQKAVITVTLGEVPLDELHALFELYNTFIKNQHDLLKKVLYVAGEYKPKHKNKNPWHLGIMAV